MGKKLTFAAAIFLLSAFLSLTLGAVPIPLSDLFRAIFHGPTATAGYIFWYVRLPRTAACLFAGAAMAVSGAVIQGVLHNRLASPSIIGVNAGAGLAVTLCCALGAISGWAIAGAAFFGAMISVLLIVFVAEKVGASRLCKGYIRMKRYKSLLCLLLAALLCGCGKTVPQVTDMILARYH